MADFSISYGITNANEGGYDPGTNEAETAMGVDRSQNPHWSGWQIVDSYKPCNTAEMNHNLRNNPDFAEALRNFYKPNYWDVLKLDLITDQPIANNLYDCSVNQGSGIAARFMQQAAGATADGIVGQQTLNAVNAGDAEAIYNKINELRKERYENTHNFAGWGHVWLSRLTPYEA